MLSCGGSCGRVAAASSMFLLMILGSITVEKCSAIGWMTGLPTVTERGSHTQKEASRASPSRKSGQKKKKRLEKKVWTSLLGDVAEPLAVVKNVK